MGQVTQIRRPGAFAPQNVGRIDRVDSSLTLAPQIVSARALNSTLCER